MKTEILYKPSYAMLKAELNQGESLFAEAGAMVSMSSNMDVKTKLNVSHSPEQSFFGRFFAFFIGLLSALAKKILGGESFFVNHFSVKDSGQGEVLLAPALTGDIVHMKLSGQKLNVQASSFLAASGQLSMKLRFGGLRALFGGEGLFLLECEGEGDLWVNAYGGIEKRTVSGSVTVDTGHMVAFSPSLSWELKTMGGLKSTLFSGEGLVFRFEGQGELWVQTRSVGGLVNWINPLLPK